MPRESAMSHIRLVFAFLLLVLAIGCGGGGGGGGGNGDGGGTGSVTYRLEGVLAANPGIPQDLSNIQVGEDVQLQLVSYDASGVRTVLAGSGWSSTDTTGASFTVSNSGLLHPVAAGSVQSVTANGDGHQATGTVVIRPVQASLVGRVIDSNSAPVRDAIVRFFNSSNQELSNVKTAFDGTFHASVPAAAVSFNIDPNTLPTSLYYRSFTYDGSRYTPQVNGCFATLPPLATGSQASLATNLVVYAQAFNGGLNPPPPPPDGCS